MRFRAMGRCAACAICVCASSAVAQGPRGEAVGVRRVQLPRAPLPVMTMPVTASITDAPFGPASQTGGSESRGTPALEPARVAGEVLAGAYAGLGGYFLFSWIGDLIIDDMPMASDGTKRDFKFYMGVAGATAATAASVAAIGNIGDQTGSYPAALTGTVAGVGVGIVINQILYGHSRLPSEGESSRVRWIEASLEALLPSIGATIGFNSTRRFK